MAPTSDGPSPLSRFRFLFRPKWIAFHVLVLAAVATMVNLGIWQLHRLDERRIDNADFVVQIEQAPVSLASVLDELRVDLEQASTTSGAPRDRLADIVGAFVDYSLAHPAFVDCAQALMRRSGPELLDEISESALFRLGRAISGALSILSAALEDGVEAGDFTVTDPTLLANTLYASGLGALQLARVGILVKEAAPGVPTVGEISPQQVREYLVASALALATLR